MEGCGQSAHCRRAPGCWCLDRRGCSAPWPRCPSGKKGEVHGIGTFGLSSLLAKYPDWLNDRKVTVLCQDRKARGPTLRNMPLALDFACDEEKQHILDLRLAPNDVTRPSARLPETPKGDCHCCSKLIHGISKNISLLVSFRRPVGRGSLCVILTPAPSQG